jgi:hypothetical protein
MYAILKNGLVLHYFKANNDFRTVEILCDKFHARMILAAAEMYGRSGRIAIAIRLSSKQFGSWMFRLEFRHRRLSPVGLKHPLFHRSRELRRFDIHAIGTFTDMDGILK